MDQNIIYSLDNHLIDKDNLILSGWAFDKDGEKIEFSILENGKKIDFKLKTVQRLDVVQFYSDSSVDCNCGFNISFQYIKSKQYELWIRSKKDQIKLSLNINKLKVKHFIERINVKDVYRQIRNDGVKPFTIRLSQFFLTNQQVYQRYFDSQLYSPAVLEKQKVQKFSYNPKVSIIVPAFKTPENFLIEMIESVRNQTYQNWQLCIADGSIECEHMDRILGQYSQIDPRVCFVKLEDNYGISGNTNKALELVDGEVITLLDHDDLLAPEALYEVVKKFNEDLHIDVVYTDEDKISMEGDKHFDPTHKPDFNLELLRSCNYICHFFAVKKEIVDEVGGFRSEYDGSQDYDFIFRCCEKARKIGHVDRVVYYWRAHINSTAQNPESKLYCYESGKKAIQAHLDRMNINAVSYRKDNYGMYGVNYTVVGKPKVTLIIYDASEKKDISCHYDNLEIIYLKNHVVGSINNCIRKSDSEFIGIMHSSFIFKEADSLEQLIARMQLKDVGAAGMKVYGADGKYLSCGRVIGVSQFAKDVLLGESIASFGYMGKAISQQEVSALSPEFILFNRQDLTEIQNLDEQFNLSGSIIDACLKLRQLNKKIILDARYAIYTENNFSMKRLPASHVKMLQNKWGKIKDPYYNRNFSKEIIYRYECKK